MQVYWDFNNSSEAMCREASDWIKQNHGSLLDFLRYDRIVDVGEREYQVDAKINGETIILKLMRI